jgi:hypothetical protein
MATRVAAETVAATFGGRTVGHSVIVFLEPPAEALPPLADLSRAAVLANNPMLGASGRQ